MNFCECATIEKFEGECCGAEERTRGPSPFLLLAPERTYSVRLEIR